MQQKSHYSNAVGHSTSQPCTVIKKKNKNKNKRVRIIHWFFVKHLHILKGLARQVKIITLITFKPSVMRFELICGKPRVCHTHRSLCAAYMCMPYISHFQNTSDHPVSLPYGALWRVISKYWHLVRSWNNLEYSEVNLSFKIYMKIRDLVSKQKQHIRYLTATSLWSSLFYQLTFKFCDEVRLCWV